MKIRLLLTQKTLNRNTVTMLNCYKSKVRMENTHSKLMSYCQNKGLTNIIKYVKFIRPNYFRNRKEIRRVQRFLEFMNVYLRTMKERKSKKSKSSTLS
jgi:hypothetical protein